MTVINSERNAILTHALEATLATLKAAVLSAPEGHLYITPKATAEVQDHGDSYRVIQTPISGQFVSPELAEKMGIDPDNLPGPVIELNIRHESDPPTVEFVDPEDEEAGVQTIVPPGFDAEGNG